MPPALSGCAFLLSQYFPSKGHQGKNVCLRRKGFEFPGARCRTIWVCQLMENIWNEQEGICKNCVTVYIGHVRCLSKTEQTEDQVLPLGPMDSGFKGKKYKVSQIQKFNMREIPSVPCAAPIKNRAWEQPCQWNPPFRVNFATGLPRPGTICTEAGAETPRGGSAVVSAVSACLWQHSFLGTQ